MLKIVRAKVTARFLSLGLAAVLSLTLFVSSSASGASEASAATRIDGLIPVEVTRLDGTVPLIIGGTVLILNEEAVSTAPVETFGFIDGYESLELHFRQSSIEQFTSTDFETARAISGDANGTITVRDTATGAKLGTGSYKLSMSNTPDCQMKGHGTWSMETEKFTVSGTVETCVNWDHSIDNFLGEVNVDGDVEMKEVEEPQGGLLGRLLGGLRGLLGR